MWVFLYGCGVICLCSMRDLYTGTRWHWCGSPPRMDLLLYVGRGWTGSGSHSLTLVHFRRREALGYCIWDRSKEVGLFCEFLDKGEELFIGIDVELFWSWEEFEG